VENRICLSPVEGSVARVREQVSFLGKASRKSFKVFNLPSVARPELHSKTRGTMMLLLCSILDYLFENRVCFATVDDPNVFTITLAKVRFKALSVLHLFHSH